jgi:hypothetical protein
VEEVANESDAMGAALPLGFRCLSARLAVLARRGL